jgi:hypothetical protein
MHRLTEAHVAYLVTLEQQGRGTPADVLADAKRDESPLHDLYDWDITVAAEAHWLDRTRAIIRLVKVVVHTEHQTIRIPRYVRDPSRPPREQGYVSVETLRLETTLAHRALVTEMERVMSSLRRARHIAVGLSLEEEIDDLLARVAGLRQVWTEHSAPPPTAGESEAASPAA